MNLSYFAWIMINFTIHSKALFLHAAASLEKWNRQ